MSKHGGIILFLGAIALLLAAATAQVELKPDCAVRGTITSGTTLTPGSGLLSSCSATGLDRMEARIIGSTAATECICVSPDATNYTSLDSEAATWSSRYIYLSAPRITNDGSVCPCSGTGDRTFEVVLY